MPLSVKAPVEYDRYFFKVISISNVSVKMSCFRSTTKAIYLLILTFVFWHHIFYN